MDLYRITKEFPKEERYGLTSQIRRSAVSIPLYISYGSVYELETQALLSDDLDYVI